MVASECGRAEGAYWPYYLYLYVEVEKINQNPNISAAIVDEGTAGEFSSASSLADWAAFASSRIKSVVGSVTCMRTRQDTEAWKVLGAADVNDMRVAERSSYQVIYQA